MLVDLSTTDTELETIIIKEYTETFFEDQYRLDKSNPQNRVYHFYRLNYGVLFEFLRKYRSKHEFEIRDRDTGEFVEVNKIKK